MSTDYYMQISMQPGYVGQSGYSGYSGEAGSAVLHRVKFDSDDLVESVLSISHGAVLEAPYAVFVQVYNNSGQLVVPTSIVCSDGTVVIDFSGLGTVSGTWECVYIL